MSLPWVPLYKNGALVVQVYNPGYFRSQYVRIGSKGPHWATLGPCLYHGTEFA